MCCAGLSQTQRCSETLPRAPWTSWLSPPQISTGISSAQGSKQAEQEQTPSAAREGEWPAAELSSFTAHVPLLSPTSHSGHTTALTQQFPCLPQQAATLTGREKPIPNTELPEGKGQEAAEVCVFHCSSLHYMCVIFLSGL